jgi:hypothetical protein
LPALFLERLLWISSCFQPRSEALGATFIATNKDRLPTLYGSQSKDCDAFSIMICSPFRRRHNYQNL